MIVTSDHGEHLGEHGFMRHGQTLYRDVLQVPLVIRFPARIAAGVRVREMVSLRDVAPTVLALLNTVCDHCFPGEALTRFWMNAAAPSGSESPGFSEVRRGIRIPDRYPNAKGDLHSLMADDFHYIVNSDGKEELYDLNRDPHEQRNVAPTAEGAAARMRREIELMIRPGQSPPPPAPDRR